jgi:hypothetical protein
VRVCAPPAGARCKISNGKGTTKVEYRIRFTSVNLISRREEAALQPRVFGIIIMASISIYFLVWSELNVFAINLFLSICCTTISRKFLTTTREYNISCVLVYEKLLKLLFLNFISSLEIVFGDQTKRLGCDLLGWAIWTGMKYNVRTQKQLFITECSG